MTYLEGLIHVLAGYPVKPTALHMLKTTASERAVLRDRSPKWTAGSSEIHRRNTSEGLRQAPM